MEQDLLNLLDDPALLLGPKHLHDYPLTLFNTAFRNSQFCSGRSPDTLGELVDGGLDSETDFIPQSQPTQSKTLTKEHIFTAVETCIAEHVETGWQVPAFDSITKTPKESWRLSFRPVGPSVALIIHPLHRHNWASDSQDPYTSWDIERYHKSQDYVFVKDSLPKIQSLFWNSADLDELCDFPRDDSATETIDLNTMMHCFFYNSPLWSGWVVEPAPPCNFEDPAWNLEWQLEYANRNFLEAFGLTSGDFGMWFRKDYHLNDKTLALWTKFYRLSQQTKRPQTYRDNFESKSGKKYWLSCTVSYLGRGADNRARFNFSCEDITPRISSETVMQQHIERFNSHLQSLLQTIPALIWSATSDGILDYINPQVSLYLFGDTLPHELNSQCNFIHESQVQYVEEKWIESMRTGKKFEEEYLLRRSDNEYRWHCSRAVPVKDPKTGAISRWHGISLDVHAQHNLKQERERALEALQLSEAKIRRLIEADIIGIVFTTLEGDIIERNGAFDSLLGLTKEDDQLNLRDLTPPEYYDIDDEAMQQLLQRGVCDSYEKDLFCKDGSRVSVLVGAARVQNELVIRYVLDITARKNAEIKAHEGARSKQLFIANVSHELRTPLVGILSMTELLLSSKPHLTTQQQDYAKTVHTSGKTLLMLIQDLLNLSQIEAGKVVLEESDFELGSVVEDVVTMMSMNANDKGVRLIYSPDHLRLFVRGDAGRLKQIILNLISNSIKFTDSGGHVVVSVVSADVDDDRVALRFEVEDTGIGISENDQQLLFQPFSQVDTGSRRRSGGTGLGLAISKQLVALFGGDIGLQHSEPGKGSTFYFTATVKLLQKDMSSPPSPQQTEAIQKVHGGNTRLYHVEDNTVAFSKMKSFVMDLLKLEDRQVEQAQTADELLGSLVSTCTDETGLVVVICNIQQAQNLSCMLSSEVPSSQQSHQSDLISKLRMLIIDNSVRNQPHLACQQIEIKNFPRIRCRIVAWPLTFSKMRVGLTRLLSDQSENEEPSPGNNSLPLRPRDQHNDISSTRVLLVEDNLINQRVAVHQLHRLGINSVVVVSNGREALEKLENTQFDLILMDCMMPVMDGYEATRQIRKREENIPADQHIPIIAMTANAFEEAKYECMRAGFNSVLVKPIEFKLLSSEINKWLRDVP